MITGNLNVSDNYHTQENLHTYKTPSGEKKKEWVKMEDSSSSDRLSSMQEFFSQCYLGLALKSQVILFPRNMSVHWPSTGRLEYILFHYSLHMIYFLLTSYGVEDSWPGESPSLHASNIRFICQRSSLVISQLLPQAKYA